VAIALKMGGLIMGGRLGHRFILSASLVCASPLASKAIAQQPTRKAAPAAARPSANQIPQVLLSERHAALCKMKVGDAFPAVSLPQLNGGEAALPKLVGTKATVVLFWEPNHWMSRIALADVAKSVAAKFTDKSVAAVGIIEAKNAQDAQADLTKFAVKFPQLLDAEGAALAQVGTGAPMRIYVLDAQQKIVWFDIEFSEATRRELAQALAVLTAK
jgi:peroxiredoxin